MMIERKILEALDACRPESDDLHSPDHPELAEAAALAREDATVQEALARVQQFDRQIGQVMEEVELPAGLAARMKARLAAASSVPSGIEATATEANATETSATVSLAQPVDTTRRHWMWVASAIAASVAVSVGIWQFGVVSEVQLSRDDFHKLSKNLHSQAQDSAAWQTDPAQAPSQFPFPQNALLVQAKRFMTFPDDRQAVAYDVTYRNQRATVIVYAGTVPGLDLVPPRRPSFNTQGVCVGLWQRNGLLFALVVEGSESTYRQLLHSNQGTLG